MLEDLTKSSDIQGLLFRGYNNLEHTSYGLFKIENRTNFQKWLDRLLTSGSISTAEDGNPSDKEIFRLNILFSASGMRKLLGDGWIPETFEPAFVEGMVGEHRSRVLGDVEDNDPGNWRWGSSNDFDGLLIAFAKSKDSAEKLLEKNIGSKNGTNCTTSFTGHRGGRTEPFGFVDGVSQPVLIGTKRHKRLEQNNPKEAQLHGIATGEMILGYPDGSGALPRSPATSFACDCNDVLAPHPEWPERRDLGKNGTYVVLRQLAQDTVGFQQYLELAAKNYKETADELAEKMVGRRKDGSALEPTIRSNQSDNNSFDFSDDLKGLHCPVGSHIRRSNPRATGAPNSKSALSVTLRHRILRRGRSYKDRRHNEVGLNFMCFNASIGRQFEFVQSTWCNNPFFHGLDKEVDPLIGTTIPDSGPIGSINRYTIPGEPYRRELSELPTFVTVKGGGYFFMPSINALRCLSNAT